MELPFLAQFPEFLKLCVLLNDFTKPTKVELPFWAQETQKPPGTHEILHLKKAAKEKVSLVNSLQRTRFEILQIQDTEIQENSSKEHALNNRDALRSILHSRCDVFSSIPDMFV